jgi:predicted outer membrane lipoprotein
MALPLGTVLAAAPGIITAAADIIKVIRERKKKHPEAETDKLSELESLVEQQALVIEELAINNRNMVMAVKVNRVISAIAIAVAAVACVVAVVY